MGTIGNGEKIGSSDTLFNEEKTLEQVINKIPKKIVGIGKIQIVVVDDGSTTRRQNWQELREQW